MPAISTEALTKSYGERVGVRDVSLQVDEGSVFGFIGPNGAGKTTTIRMLLGFLKPTSGRARVLGQDAWSESAAIKRDVGYLPGDLRLPGWMDGRKALRVVGAARSRDLTAPGHELAEYFALELGVPVRDMSRGMRQKLGLILTLAHRPRLLVLDEPTSALDPLTQERLCSLLRERAEGGATVFFSSHVLSEVQDLCERVAFVRSGEIIVDTTLAELRSQVRRDVTIEWRESPPPPQLADGLLEVYRQTETVWHSRLVGTTPELLDWLSGRPVADLAVEPPDLDSLFMRFYRDEVEGA